MHASVSTSSEDLEKKQQRHPWLVMGGITLLVLTVLFALIVWYDGPAPDDSMMTALPSAKTASSDPLSEFCLELEKSTVGGPPEVREECRYNGLASQRNRQPDTRPAAVKKDALRRKEVENFLQKNEPFVATFTKLLQTNADTWQWSEQSSIRTLARPEYLIKLNTLRYVLYMKVEMLMWQGRTEDAVTLSLDMCRLGKGLSGAKGGTAQLLSGINMASTGQRALEHALTAAEPSPQLLRQCITALAALEAPQLDDVLLTLKTDYQDFKSRVLHKDFLSALGDGRAPGTGEKLIGLLFFKPNQTLAELLSHELPVMEGLSKDWHATIVAASTQESIRRKERNRGVLLFANPNFGGRAAAWNAAYGSVYKLEDALGYLMRNRQIRLVLALRLHALDKGNLPPNLEELVPAYLPEMPEDLYSGKPMLWNAAKGIVYSVGNDMRDDGGSGRSDIRNSRDLIMPYWWAATGKTTRSP